MADILTDEQVMDTEQRANEWLDEETLETDDMRAIVLVRRLLRLIATLRHYQAECDALGRRLLKWQEQSWDYEHMNKLLNEENARLQAENERLTQELLAENGRVIQAQSTHQMLVAENARLRESINNVDVYLENLEFILSRLRYESDEKEGLEQIEKIRQAIATEGDVSP